MRKEVKIKTSEYRKESFYLCDKYDLRDLPTPKSVEKVKPDCEDQNTGMHFFKLFDENNDLIDKIAVEDSDLFKLSFKNYNSNFEVFMSEYDFFTKDFIAVSSKNFVKSDYIDYTKEDAIESVKDEIIERFGVLDFDDDFIKTFFDDLE